MVDNTDLGTYNIKGTYKVAPKGRNDLWISLSNNVTLVSITVNNQKIDYVQSGDETDGRIPWVISLPTVDNEEYSIVVTCSEPASTQE